MAIFASFQRSIVLPLLLYALSSHSVYARGLHQHPIEVQLQVIVNRHTCLITFRRSLVLYCLIFFAWITKTIQRLNCSIIQMYVCSYCGQRKKNSIFSSKKTKEKMNKLDDLLIALLSHSIYSRVAHKCGIKLHQKYGPFVIRLFKYDVVRVCVVFQFRLQFMGTCIWIKSLKT